MRTDVPLDVELEIAMWIPDFLTLHSFILVARTYNQLFSAHRSSIAKAVAHNHFGEHLQDVLRLVNTLKAVGYRRRPREANNYEDHEYKSTFIRQLLRCEETVNDIHLPVFKTLVTGGVKWLENIAYLKHSVNMRTPSVTERTRIIRAAYRFWTYCCIDEDYAGSFFSKFNTLEVLEMAQFEAALETWVDGMWGDTECLDDYHYDKICGVVSCGLGTISEIWGLFRTLVIPDKNDAGDIYGLFSERMGVCCENYGFEGGFFRSALTTFLDSKDPDAEQLIPMYSNAPAEPILDEEHEKAKQRLSRLQEKSSKNT